MSLEQIQSILADFSSDRPTLQENNTKERLLLLLQGEVNEAVEDGINKEEFGRELADIIIFALSLANLEGINMDEEVREKIAFNHTRYTADKFQSGCYEEARCRAKKDEREFAKRDFYSIET